MKSKTPNTYALLINSEEKERNLSETFIYLLLVGSAVFSIWHAAHQPITTASMQQKQITTIAQAAAQSQQPRV
jgi:hypothetical protein